MKPLSGQYFVGLDHIRALAAFMIFSWHFTRGGLFASFWEEVPTPIFPFSILSEGHTGVALFIALSGYLFAKLLDDKRILFLPFIWSRLVRLMPLLIFVFAVVGFRIYAADGDILNYGKRLLQGFLMPTWPNGGWSITVEFHFYLLLPLLLLVERKWVFSLAVLLGLSLLFRYLLFQDMLDIKRLSYNTIVGRLDQFLLGMIAYRIRLIFVKRHLLVGLAIIAFHAFYNYFDHIGGHQKAPAWIWIILPTLEGLAYATFIAWYDNSFQHSSGKISNFIALIGQYSYSIYLLHFFFFLELYSLFSRYIFELSNLYLALMASLFCFLLMVPIAYLSFNLIEKPFFRFRINYYDRKNLSSKQRIRE